VRFVVEAWGIISAQSRVELKLSNGNFFERVLASAGGANGTDSSYLPPSIYHIHNTPPQPETRQIDWILTLSVT
jgi:hypothetical protein